MLAIAVHATSFLKELEESTSGRWPAGRQPAVQPGLEPVRSRGILARAAAAAGAVRCWLRPSPCRLAQ